MIDTTIDTVGSVCMCVHMAKGCVKYVLLCVFRVENNAVLSVAALLPLIRCTVVTDKWMGIA